MIELEEPVDAIVRGETGRRKTVRVEGGSAATLGALRGGGQR